MFDTCLINKFTHDNAGKRRKIAAATYDPAKQITSVEFVGGFTREISV